MSLYCVGVIWPCHFGVFWAKCCEVYVIVVWITPVGPRSGTDPTGRDGRDHRPSIAPLGAGGWRGDMEDDILRQVEALRERMSRLS